MKMKQCFRYKNFVFTCVRLIKCIYSNNDGKEKTVLFYRYDLGSNSIMKIVKRKYHMQRKSRQLLFPKKYYWIWPKLPLFPHMRRKWLRMLCPFGLRKQCSKRQIFKSKRPLYFSGYLDLNPIGAWIWTVRALL